MGRSPCCSKEGLNRGAWTALEDKILTSYIKAHGEGKWRNLPKRAGLKRCGKSCRLRWLNYLRPDIKRGNISHDEEELIIRLHKLLGNRWSLIAGRLPGRTDNEIKNYWNTNLGKRIKNEQSTSPELKFQKGPSNKSRLNKIAPESPDSVLETPTKLIYTKATKPPLSVLFNTISSNKAILEEPIISTSTSSQVSLLHNCPSVDTMNDITTKSQEDQQTYNEGEISGFFDFGDDKIQLQASYDGDSSQNLHTLEGSSCEEQCLSFSNEPIAKDWTNTFCDMDLESLQFLFDDRDNWP